MLNIATVRLSKGLRDVPPNAQGLLHGQRTGPKSFAKRLTLQVFEREIRKSGVGSHRIQGHDVRMAESRGRTRFIKGVLFRRRDHEFEGHPTPEFFVARRIDLPHSPLPQGPKNAEMVDLISCFETPAAVTPTRQTRHRRQHRQNPAAIQPAALRYFLDGINVADGQIRGVERSPDAEPLPDETSDSHFSEHDSLAPDFLLVTACACSTHEFQPHQPAVRGQTGSSNGGGR